MKRKALLILGISALGAILTAPLGAQSLSSHRFTIPFEFGVQGQTMPAGEYVVRPDANSGFVHVESRDGQVSVTTLTYHAGNSAMNDRATLSFHRYGGQYFLAQISEGTGDMIRGLSKTGVEREAAKTASSRSSETVTLAALAGR